MRRRAPAILVAALVVGACAGPTIPPETSQLLQQRVADIRSVIEDGRVFAARQQLGELTTLVGRLLDDGVIDEGTWREILAAAREVRSALDLAPDRSPPPTETTTPSPPPEEEHGNQGEGKGKGKGKGKGHGNDD